MSKVRTPAGPTKRVVRIAEDLALLGWVFLGFGVAGFAVYLAESPRLLSVGQYAAGVVFWLFVGSVAVRELPRKVQAAVAMPREAQPEERSRFWRAELLKVGPFAVAGLGLLVVAPGILSWYAGFGFVALRQSRWVGRHERETGTSLFRERGVGWRRPLYTS